MFAHKQSGEIMKKKIIVSVLLVLLVIGIAGAVSFHATRGDALQKVSQLKSNREAQTTNKNINVEFTRDKYCEVYYEFNTTSCFLCFKYTVADIDEEYCLTVPEGTSQKEDDEVVKDYIDWRVSQYHEQYLEEYKERDDKGRIIRVKVNPTQAVPKPK